MRSVHRTLASTSALTLALGAGGCSVLFSPSHWSENGEADAATASADAFVPEGTDADLDAASSMSVDAAVSPDAFEQTCTTNADCAASNGYCDGTICRTCDADGDGIRSHECAGDTLHFYDCDPDHAPPVSSFFLTDGFDDSLRVFEVGGEVYALFKASSRLYSFHVGTDTAQRAITYEGGGLREIDAVRLPDRVVVGATTDDAFVQFTLTDAGLTPAGRRPFSDISLLSGGAPRGVLAILGGDASDVLIESQYEMPGFTGGRGVFGVGSGHEARVLDSGGSPDDRVAASSGSLAIVPGPGTTGVRRSFFLATDVRPLDSGNVGHLEVPMTVRSSAFGQVAVSSGDLTGDSERIAIMGHADPGAGTFTAYAARCPTSPQGACVLEGQHSYPAPMRDGGLAMHSAPGSSSVAIVFTAADDAFDVSLLETSPSGGGFGLPDALIPMFTMPVPAVTGTRALAMDLTANLAVEPPVVRLTLARAVANRIQTMSVDVCVDLTSM